MQSNAIELAQLRSGLELRYCFGLLIVLHAWAFRTLLVWDPNEKSGWMTWIGISGVGTLAAWFACAARPLGQKLVRAIIVVSVVCWVSQGSFYSFSLPLQASRRVFSPNTLSGLLSGMYGETFWFTNSPQFTLLCWLAGAVFAAYMVSWFLGLRLIAPDVQTAKSPLSMWKIFVLVFFAAVASYFIGSDNWQARLSYLSNGASQGVIACGVAWGVFEPDWRKRIFVPGGTIAGVVLLDMTAGWLVGAWRGDPLGRLNYATSFAFGLSVSPLVSFTLLRAYGYRSTSDVAG